MLDALGYSLEIYAVTIAVAMLVGLVIGAIRWLSRDPRNPGSGAAKL